MSFNLNNYEQVDVRLKRFMDDFKDSRINVVTELVATPDNLKGILFKCTIEVSDLEGNVVYRSTGWANEVPGDGMVNKDSVVENCETSAVGRALANLGYSGSKRASKEEMSKVGRGAYSGEVSKATSPKQVPASTPSQADTAEAIVPFGDFKGHTAVSVPLHQLKWVIDVLKNNLADPKKAKFRAANEGALNELEPIYLQRASSEQGAGEIA